MRYALADPADGRPISVRYTGEEALAIARWAYANAEEIQSDAD